MVIPPERMTAAFWCFQFSLFTMVLTLINQPYTATIIAHERMNVYAYLAILDSVLKLGVCFAVLYSSVDKLILYGFLLFMVSVINQAIYMFFCRSRFEESRFAFSVDKKCLGICFRSQVGILSGLLLQFLQVKVPIYY